MAFVKMGKSEDAEAIIEEVSAAINVGAVIKLLQLKNTALEDEIALQALTSACKDLG